MPLAPNITHRLELRPGPAPRDIRHGLFQALGLPGKPPARPIEFDTLLKEAPAEESRVLVCDEAQRMKKTGFEFRRSRWDDKRTNIAVICAGGDGCYKVLRRGPRLASKIFIWQEFTRMRNPPLHRTPTCSSTATGLGLVERWAARHPDAVRLVPPQGTPFAWIQLRTGGSSLALCRRALEAGLLLAAGETMGSDAGFRLGFDRDVDTVTGGLRRLGPVLLPDGPPGGGGPSGGGGP
ncbi:ATP-binding protein, partial [Streptomyces microflavus]